MDIVPSLEGACAWALVAAGGRHLPLPLRPPPQRRSARCLLSLAGDSSVCGSKSDRGSMDVQDEEEILALEEEEEQEGQNDANAETAIERQHIQSNLKYRLEDDSL